MIIFLKRFFLFLFAIGGCLFLVNLLIPGVVYAQANEVLVVQQQAPSSYINSHSASFNASLTQVVTPTPVLTTVPTTPPVPTTVPTPTPVPTTVPTPTPVPTAVSTPTPVPTTVVATPTPTPTMVPTATAVPPPPTGGNTSANGHATINVLIFTMGGSGVLLVILGVILYFVYSRPG